MLAVRDLVVDIDGSRILRGVSLDDIAAATKIGTRLLRALEEEHFDSLPGGIFNKGYVRAYAKYVGIDEEQAVAEYLVAARETSPDVRLIAQQNASPHGDVGRSGAGCGSGWRLASLSAAAAGASGVQQSPYSGCSAVEFGRCCHGFQFERQPRSGTKRGYLVRADLTKRRCVARACKCHIVYPCCGTDSGSSRKFALEFGCRLQGKLSQP